MIIIIIIIIIIITITIIVIIIIIIITAVEKCGENGVEAYMIAIVSKPPDTQSPSYKNSHRRQPEATHLTLQYLHC